MDIVVCVKQVPDISEIKRVRTDPERGTIIREGIASILNPFDEHAVEEAVRIREKHGGSVTVISMGPQQAIDALQQCLAMGADRAILLCDPAFAGSDTLATAYTLGAAIRKAGHFDIVLCGQQAIDGDTAQVGPGIAENLRIPQITYVATLDISGSDIRAQRETEYGYQVIQCKTPVLLTVTRSLNEPRIPTFSAIAEALDKTVTVWTADDLEVDRHRLGLGGSPTRVVRVWVPERKRGGQLLRGEPAEVALRLAQVLREEKLV